MFTLAGDFGKVMFSNSVDSNGLVSSRYMSLNTEAALNFFKKITLLKTNLVANSLGLYSFQKAGRNNKVRFASFNTPRHLLSSRKNGCSWNPKGGVKMNTSEFSLCPVEYNGEECPDAFYGGCLESIFGTGNQVRDFFATQEGRQLMGELLNTLYIGLGNSFYDLAWYGQHDLITDPDANDWYTVDDKEWANYKDQQDACGGLMTIIDWFKKDGLSNFNVPINTGDISADGTRFVGSAEELFDRLLDAQPTEMKIAAKRGASTQSLRGIILVDPKIFRRYEEELLAQWNHIPATFAYFYTGSFCQEAGCIATDSVPGVLKYKGHWVVCMDEWEDFASITGTKQFRAMVVAPGNFGIGYDVDDINQFNGLGLRMNQKLDAPWQGKVFFDTTFKVGTGLLDKDYIVNASKILVPES